MRPSSRVVAGLLLACLPTCQCARSLVLQSSLHTRTLDRYCMAPSRALQALARRPSRDRRGRSPVACLRMMARLSAVAHHCVKPSNPSARCLPRAPSRAGQHPPPLHRLSTANAPSLRLGIVIHIPSTIKPFVAFPRTLVVVPSVRPHSSVRRRLRTPVLFVSLIHPLPHLAPEYESLPH